MTKMRNVMLDLETMGTSPGCAIMSIGAVDFGPDGADPARHFHAIINMESCVAAGLRMETDTMAWWKGQPDAAREATYDPSMQNRGKDLGLVLASFQRWLDTPTSGVWIWGNGADFDLPLLWSAFRACGIMKPWPAYSGRCYRTMKNLMPAVLMTREGMHHRALDDAISQANHLAKIVEVMKIREQVFGS